MDIDNLTDIDKLTDEQLEELVASQELKCKIEPKSGELKCATPEVINRAIARLRNPVARVVFEVTSEPAAIGVHPPMSKQPEPKPDTRLNPTES
ncbi:unnamed protein product [marine sediment metagenome]|uniref:Uncharacterized protein n=1 Tax=marine sediment metagenome TaxID=412755 RepID=X1RUD0_9ZZZZ